MNLTRSLQFLAVVMSVACPAAFAEEGTHGWVHQGPARDFVLPGVLFDWPGPQHGPCAELKLEDAQKSKLKDAYFKFKESKIDLEARIEKAHLKYKKVLFDKEADLSAAKKASEEIVSAVKDKVQAEENHKNEVFFEILKPEQRGTAHACMMMIIMAHHHPFGPAEHRHEKAQKKGKHGAGKGEAKSDPADGDDGESEEQPNS